MMNKTGPIVLIGVVLLVILAMGVFSAAKIIPGNLTAVRGSGNVIEETRPVSGIDGVNLATIGHLFINVGDTESLRIEAEDNLLQYFSTEVSGGNLCIRTRDNVNLNPTKPVNYYLKVKGLDAIELTSAGNIDAPDLTSEQFAITVASSGDLVLGNLDVSELKTKISSSGDVTMGILNADQLEIDISSSGDLTIFGGNVGTQNIKISSSGNYQAENLTTDQAEARLSSDGSATIWVQEHLKATVNSSGDLRYRGSPTLEVTTNSSGDVVQISQ